MVDVKLIKELNFSADQVWALLGDYGNMNWMDGPPRHEVIGEGIGMIRRVLMEGMDPIDEVLETHDDASMSYSYTIPRGLPLPVTDYRSSCRVEAIDPQRSRVHWSCVCHPTDENMSAEDVQALLQDTYSTMLGWLEDYLSKA